MQVMIQMFDDAATWDAEIAKFSPEEMKTLIDFMEGLGKELESTGELVETRGFNGPSGATTVQAVLDGPPKVTAGPEDPNGKILSGYWVVEVSGMERAVELAARISAAPGHGGEPYNFPVELHVVADGPPEV